MCFPVMARDQLDRKERIEMQTGDDDFQRKKRNFEKQYG